MRLRIHRAAAFLLFALAPTLVAAQSQPLYFLNWPAVQVVEGDEGYTEALVHWELSGAPTREVRFYISTAAAGETLSYFGDADPGYDYEPIPRTLVVVPATQRAGDVRVRIRGDYSDEPTQRLFVHFTEIVGAETVEHTNYSRGGVDIIDDDDVIAGPEGIVRNDNLVVGATSGDGGAASLDVFLNDSVPNEGGTTLTVIAPPSHGTTSIFNQGNMPSQMSITYSADIGYVGSDHLRYRYCSAAAFCAEADVAIEVLPYRVLERPVYARHGREVFDLIAPVAMPAARFVASPLARPVRRRWETDVDLTPGSPWDSEQGRAWTLVSLPPLSSGHADWRLAADVGTVWNSHEKMSVYIGIDRNGDAKPSADELLCAGGGRRASCEAPFRQEPGVTAYWVMIHSRYQDVLRSNVRYWQVPVTTGDGSLVATGPGRVENKDFFRMTLSWSDDSMSRLEPRYGVVRIQADDGQALGDLPVRLDYLQTYQESMLMVPGSPRTFTLDPDEALKGLFFDVPAGATRVFVDAAASVDVDYFLVLSDGMGQFGEPAEPDDPKSGFAPNTGAAVSATGPGGNASVVLQGTALQPGRWFLDMRNMSGVRGDATVQLEIEGTGPTVRPGSYFDAQRPGSGLFLYPAGGEWVGLWYTYQEDDASTWYYLQAPAPGANGLWTSGIYRTAWSGTSRTITRVGSATLAPSGADAFQLSYVIDGVSGTRPLAALGRGCLATNGAPADISSHWFDPARAGTGYSVQSWSNYEYFAAFVYDRQGMPTFLAAELAGLGQADKTVTLQLLNGACPTCEFRASQRQDVGTLRRTLSAGKLATIAIDARWNDLWTPESVWTTVDQVQLLGGAGTTQGCAP